MDSILIDTDILFTNQLDELGNRNYTLTKYNIKEDSMTDIELPNAYLNQLRKKDDFLFISHYNCIQNEGNTISILNLKDTSINSLKFNHNVAKFEMKNNKLLILDNEYVYVYELSSSNQSVNLVEKFIVNDINNNYRISGLFIKE